MDNRSEARDFLASRRARITPQQAGLPLFGTNRRVPGLRRDEVAVLAGISVEYYTRLERGNLGGASEGVLDAVAGALHLDDTERAHLFDLSRTANMPANKPRRPTAQRVRPGVQRVLDAMVAAPAWVRNGRSDFLAGNRLGRALYAPIFKDPVRPANTARFTFLDPHAKEFYADWDRIAHDMVGVLRAEAGRNPYDRSLTDLIGELSTRSEDFRVRWAAHNVRTHRTGQKRLHHPAVGDLDLTFEAMELRADPGLTLLVYTAEVGSTTQDALNLLATWSATFEQINDSQAARVSEPSGGGDLAMKAERDG
ncbi:MAG: helix-turn-helix transcriptional regulator [Candidatus Dormibacteria bacterium]|jgi:transcriptional regulator with XRE-family HTH domain